MKRNPKQAILKVLEQAARQSSGVNQKSIVRERPDTILPPPWSWFGCSAVFHQPKRPDSK